MLVLVTTTVVSLGTACSAGIGGVQGTPGAAGLRDPYFPKAGNGGYDVTHYDLTLDVDPAAQHLRGTAVITARATQDLSAFNLDLAGLTVESAQVEGRPAAVNRAAHELTLRPDAEVESHLHKGRTFRTVVRYSGSPLTLTDPDRSKEGWLRTADGSVALGEPVGAMAWFPGNNHPSDKASYDLTVTVPKGLTAVSNGELTSRRTSGATTTFHWHTAAPMATYLATLTIGHFDTKASTTPDGIKVFTAVDPKSAAASARTLARIPEVVRWEAERFGPYPFSSTGAIVERANDSGYALETQNRPFFPGPPGIGLLVHEMSHQWFGNSVTPESWRDMWLNEGFATYAEWLWQADKEGVPVQDSFDRAFASDANWAFPPTDPPTTADISQAPVYGRGAMVIHKIRQAMGDDKRFFALVRGWTKAHRHGNASTADFTAYAEKTTGLDLTSLWNTWLYGRSRPATKG
ncbi:M1 family metallopeptidase [Streptomyces sp. NPDC051286]|uniref:M1 family metallopeptidase n=1 Tax=Streptomyces sp. NPDC051286 TaxID=3365647 RepID=UPI00378FC1EE